MPTFISASDVRNALVTLTTADIPDLSLTGNPRFIPAGEAWIEKVLGAAPTTLSATDQAIAKSAEVAWVAIRVIASAPVPGVTAGPTSISPIPAGVRKEVIQQLEKEIDELLGLLGAATSFGCASSVDYKDYPY